MVTLGIKNFRSIKNQEVELAPITVIYGPNGSGKSSLLYALLTMKNVILKPSSSPSSFFNFNFMNLGSYEAVVHKHHQDKEIGFQIKLNVLNHKVGWKVQFGKQEGRFQTYVDDGNKARQLSLELPVSFPYGVDRIAKSGSTFNEQLINVIWDGITVRLEAVGPHNSANKATKNYATILNAPGEMLRNLGMVPLQRGFSKFNYSVIPVSPSLITEDEMASLLANDRYLVPPVSRYLERITGRELRVNIAAGTTTFSLDVAERGTGAGTELVNDGFGVNQIVWFLARALHRGNILDVCRGTGNTPAPFGDPKTGTGAGGHRARGEQAFPAHNTQ